MVLRPRAVTSAGSTRGDTVPEFERVMDRLKPGELSEPVRSPFGYHLIQVLERRVQEASADRKR